MSRSLAAVRRYSTSVTITDPLVKYQALVATGVYSPDQSQHRLAKHLQKVYGRLKDYTPAPEYRERLKQIAELTRQHDQRNGSDADNDGGPGMLAVKSHPIWRNPLVRRLFTAPEGNSRLALVRVLADHEAALHIDSPRGLFLSGEVGTGKSMLIDLLADGLPNARKRRWHFNTFMLYAFSQLERFRRAGPAGGPASTPDGGEYSLLWLAKQLVEESPILFLDEFQLPDRAASKILSHLFIAFFQLGGVLVASSNRVPEELQKAIGVDYTAPARGGFVRSFFGGKATQGRGELFGSSSDFAAFLEVLKARCDFWHMEGATDWRRRDVVEAGGSETVSASVQLEVNGAAAAAAVGVPPAAEDGKLLQMPWRYFLPSDSAREASWRALWDHPEPTPWQPATLVVYGRTISIPMQRDGHVFWDFERLVEAFGPADYVSMASTYHTFIIDNVPVLTVLKKNEARRFITLLDALYEAKCKLVVRAAAGPDQLFFPETRAPPGALDADGQPVVDADAIHSETVAEVYQDSEAPFRPNISFYDTGAATAKYDPDQDSDFGLADEAQRRRKVDFGNTGAFTGEDERFAYKRAASRLWEMCGEAWHARTGEWWQPLPASARHWEAGAPSTPRRLMPGSEVKAETDATMGPSVELEGPAGLERWRLEALREADERRG
jgi:predicted ATPase